MELTPPPLTPEETRLLLDELYAWFTFDLVAREPYEHLHFGLWEGVPREARSLPEAQQAYADAVVALLPHGCRSVLDVGCGLGSIARQLAVGGVTVTAISPREDHIARLQAEPTDGVTFSCARFEDTDPTHTVDAVLFAESFNFVCPVADAVAPTLERCRAWLAPHGHVLIADWLSADVSAAVRTAPAFAPADERDVSESVDYTFDALQQRFERGTRAYHELLMRVLDATNPALAIDVRDHLANVPSAALRTLFSGSLADRDMAAERRYLLMLLGRES